MSFDALGNFPFNVPCENMAVCPTSLYTSLLLVLQESTSITNSLSELFLFPTPSKKLFDMILFSQGYSRFLIQGKLNNYDKVGIVLKIKNALFIIPRKIIYPTWIIPILVVFLLNMIPLIGPILVIVVRASTIGPKYHQRYFTLKYHRDERQKKKMEHIQFRRGQYIGYGIVAASLEALPILGFFFKFTNFIGASLWCCDMLKHEKEAKST
ncbi:hypothetical protein PACTADRAFT_17603 [Pachysolen tannophilus NRRL Y-2460]|uniref:Outer spore wall protein RRT8 n=1 Tax=Pachysolen tannophilus NRRL Y-2460 TaxID=669874 RepID=A0A1E4TT61_PACTA|nr:hypothetical protein PACTADRAFT_17603 [Pachysolen tannophilus NRRL Y-2460]